jgi:hypothetical protein
VAGQKNSSNSWKNSIFFTFTNFPERKFFSCCLDIKLLVVRVLEDYALLADEKYQLPGSGPPGLVDYKRLSSEPPK